MHLNRKKGRTKDPPVDKTLHTMRNRFMYGGMLVLLLGGSFWGGTLFNRMYTRNQATTEQSVENLKSTSNQIAIVNLDAGAQSDGQTINYATKLMTDLADNFVITGLLDARSGVDEGRYGAYIIIPATFSASVVSLNTTPTKSELQYEISDNLQSNVKENVIYDVLDFSTKMNNELSYLYINSILTEFHTTQDGAKTVMTNDQASNDVLLKIKPNDLVAMIPVEELKEDPQEGTYVDVSDYMEKNTEFANTMSDKYEYYISLSKNDYDALTQQESNLVSQWTQMETTLNNIDLLHATDGTSILDTGSAGAEDLVDKENQALAEKSKEITSNLNSISSGIATTQGQLNQSITQYNETSLPAAKEASIEGVASYMKSAMPITAMSTAGNLSVGDTAVTIPYTNDTSIVQAQFKVMTEYMDFAETNMTDMVTQINDLNETITDLEAQLNAEDSSEESTTEPDAPKTVNMPVFTPTSAALTATGSTTWDELKSLIVGSENIPVNTVTINTDSVATQVTDAIETKRQAQIEKAKTGIDSVLTQNFLYYDGLALDSTNTALTDETTGKSVHVTDVMTQQQDSIKGLLDNGAATITTLNKDDVKDSIKTGITNPIAEISAKVKENITAQYENEKKQMGDYSKAAEEYNPLDRVDKNELTQITTDMQSNGSNLQKALEENDKMQKEYVDGIYKTTQENISTLQKNIEQAKKDSDQTVESGLSDAQHVMTDNSKENQSLLASITTKLAYTRLGSLEYTQAYEFIADPLSIHKESSNASTGGQQSNSANAGTTAIAANATHTEIPFAYIGLILLGIASIGIMAAAIKLVFLSGNHIAQQWADESYK